MTCPNCGGKNFYDLEDGRPRCSTCFFTADKRVEPKTEPAQPEKPTGKFPHEV